MPATIYRSAHARHYRRRWEAPHPLFDQAAYNDDLSTDAWKNTWKGTWKGIRDVCFVAIAVIAGMLIGSAGSGTASTPVCPSVGVAYQHQAPEVAAVLTPYHRQARQQQLVYPVEYNP